jgi:hypothetical protein
MKALMLYRPNTENARVAEEYVADFERLQGKTIELMSLDTKDGAAMTQLYDLPSQPILIIIREDGQLMSHWAGPPFPLTSEVAAYLVV